MTKEVVCNAISSSSSRHTEQIMASILCETDVILQDLREYTAMERELYKDQALDVLEEISEIAPSYVTAVQNMPQESFGEIFSMMGCLVCNRIPSPFKRYICPDGHVFCTSCGDERLVKHGSKCMIEDSEKSAKEDAKKRDSLAVNVSSTLSLPVTLAPYYWMNGGQSEHFPLCQQKLNRYPADPVFSAMWMNATWRCPLFKTGCKETVKGFDLFEHITNCREKTKMPENATEGAAAVSNPTCAEKEQEEKGATERIDLDDSTEVFGDIANCTERTKMPKNATEGAAAVSNPTCAEKEPEVKGASERIDFDDSTEVLENGLCNNVQIESESGTDDDDEGVQRVVTCYKQKSEKTSLCAIAGCSRVMCIDGVVNHLLDNHKIYAMAAGNDEHRSWKTGGRLYIPQSKIEAGCPYYTIIRCCRRFFLFCMEPSTVNTYDVGFWIRRISNMDNSEDEDRPFFKYDLRAVNNYAEMQVVYKNNCVPWRKPTQDIFVDRQCMTLSFTFVLDQLVFSCEESDCDDDVDVDFEGKENGYVPVDFNILSCNGVGDLYCDKTTHEVTSSMESLLERSISNISDSTEDEADGMDHGEKERFGTTYYNN